MADKNNRIDADILQCKEDILRASDIIPPFNHKPQESQPAKPSAADADITSTEKQRKKSEIPKFDLAEQILAQHRRVTAIKRKAPKQKTESERSDQQTNSETHIGPIPIISFEQEQVIAEIVARDIKRLCSNIS